MLTLLGAKSAAASSARGRYALFNRSLLAAIALALSGCMPATTQMVVADPTDPAAKVARASYRSTIAPYSSLRPATPAPWRDRNDAVTPQPKQDR
jgi:PBP1b-binding outer membrane lipoprotein LpoB